MNDHAGWTNTGICVSCGSWDSSDACNSSPEAMLDKIESLHSRLWYERFEKDEFLSKLEQACADEENPKQKILQLLLELR